MHRTGIPPARLAIVVCALLAAGVVLAPAARADEAEETLALTRRLAAVPGVSGYERPVRDAIRAALPTWANPDTDNLGNLAVTVGSGAPHRLVLARMDEAGYVVSAVEPTGYLRVQRLATEPLPALFDQLHLGQPVVVGARRGDAAGVVVMYSTHLWRGDGPPLQRLVEDEDLLIDIGARSEEQVRAAGVAVLDPVVIARRIVDLAGGRVAGPAVGSRAGCAILLRLLWTLEPAKVGGTLTVAFATQGLVHGRGAERLAARFGAEEVVVVEPLPAGPAAGRRGAAPAGPLIASPGSDSWSPALFARLSGIADQLAVPLRPAAVERPGEGSVFMKRAAVAQVTPAIAYPGTPAEIVAGEDAGACVRILTAYVEDARPLRGTR